MEYLKFDANLDAGDTVVVTLDKQANVQLMDSTNFNNYRSGRRYTYYGGLATVSPTNIIAPSSGLWFVIINLGGYSGTVRANVSIKKG